MPPPPVDQPRGRTPQRPSRPQPRERNEEEKILRPQRRHVDAGPAADQSRDHDFRRHHREGAFREARRQGRTGHEEADGPRNFRGHQPDPRRQAGHRGRPRFRRLHRYRQLRSGSHAGSRDRRRGQGPVRSARPWSPSWATSITARPRCSTPSAKPMSRDAKPAASRSTSALTRWT